MTTARASTGWWPYLSSFTVHGALLALVAVGWFRYRPPLPQPLQLAIEATVVTEQPAAPAALPAPAQPEPAPPPLEPEPAAEPAPPQPDPAEVRRQAEAEQRRVEAEAAEAERRLEAQKQAAADKKAQLARQKIDDEKKRRAEQQQKAEKETLEREQADLRARMAAEERAIAAKSGAQAAQYKALIRARIERAWIRPPTARAGLDCEVRVTQVSGGAVSAVRIDRCNGDAAVRESIEAAVYRASPLPVPENPDLFERNLVFNFRPND